MRKAIALLLIACLSCGASALDVATQTANVAGTTAIAAHDELRVLCVTAESNAKTLDQANQVIVTCTEAEDAYGAFRAAWLTLAAALRAADPPADLPDLVANVTDAATTLANAVHRVEVLAKELAQ